MVKRSIAAEDLKIGGVADPSPKGLDQGDYASFLARSPAERRLLQERIAEADKGVFISGEAMHRWIESWRTENELPPPEPDVFLKPRHS